MLHWLLPVIKGWMSSCRLSIADTNSATEFLQQPHANILYLWHEAIPLSLPLLQSYGKDRDFVAFVSGSRDGKKLAHLLESLCPVEILSIPHLQRRKALKTAENYFNKPRCTLLITPDGPRGPARQFKPGLAWMAYSGNLPIWQLQLRANYYFKAPTWDKSHLPLPFTTINASLQQLLPSPPYLSPEDLQERLNALEKL